uniref:Uncharacterized protein n=1 Tax=Anguilla anguilla TaxID=7936 RepID=A0A0E9SWL4_ANGAN
MTRVNRIFFRIGDLYKLTTAFCSDASLHSPLGIVIQCWRVTRLEH